MAPRSLGDVGFVERGGSLGGGVDLLEGIFAGIVAHFVGRHVGITCVHFAFGQEAEIADAEDPVLVGFAHAGEDVSVFGRVDEVVDFVGIILQVVEFFGRLGFPEVRLGRIELALVVEFFSRWWWWGF